MYFPCFTFLKSLFISKKKKVLHLSQETQIGRSVFKALTSNWMAVEKLSNKLFYFVLYSASIVNATLSNTDTQSQPPLTV